MPLTSRVVLMFGQALGQLQAWYNQNMCSHCIHLFESIGWIRRRTSSVTIPYHFLGTQSMCLRILYTWHGLERPSFEYTSILARAKSDSTTLTRIFNGAWSDLSYHSTSKRAKWIRALDSPITTFSWSLGM